MAKLAHHHPVRNPSAIQDWFGRIIVVAAIAGGVFVLFSALTSHVSAPW